MGDLTSDRIKKARQLDTNRKQRLWERFAAAAKRVSIRPLTVDPDCKAILPEYIARTYCVVGIGTDGTIPVIAMADVTDCRAMEKIYRTHPNCRIVRSLPDQVKRTIDELYW